MKINLISENLTKKDIFNMRAASVSMKDVVDRELHVDAYAQIEDTDENTGDIRQYNYIVSDGVCYSGNSVVIAKCMKDLADYIGEVGEATIKIVNIRTKNRTALSMVIV